MRTCTMLLAAATLAGLAGTAAAQDNAGKPGDKPGRAALAARGGDALFSKLDRNGDGVITRDEIPKPERFDALDTDKDGKVTKEELQGGFRKLADRSGQQAVAARLKQLDTDGDGKISKAEYEASFAKLDKDGDGFVTEEEMSAAFGAAREARPGKEGREGKARKTETPGSAPIKE